jgi:hypothetical protein
MAIGLEIEIAVPIDRLQAADLNFINAQYTNSLLAPLPKYSAAGLAIQQRINTAGKVVYGPTHTSGVGFRVEADHDDRVRSNQWPPREGGDDSIIEIVMHPPAETVAQFNAAMTQIGTWINTMMLRTNNLTQRWVNGLGGGVSVGPLTGPAAFPPHVRHANHNLKGSIQVNVGIDLREYHSMMKWFTKSNYARSRNEADPAAQAVYRQSKADMREAVNLGRTIVSGISAGLTPVQRAQMGNLRGWITHMALYLKRGTIAGGLGGTAKNLAPALLKSPPAVAAQYGMTPNEQAYFTLNLRPIVNQILVAVGRPAVPLGTPLNSVDIFQTAPGGGGTIANLTTLGSGFVPLAGTPILTPTGVGPVRGGNATVGALPAVAVAPGVFGGGPATRGGIVAEFRTLPGYYDGVNAWRQLGLNFLHAALQRNQRSGIAP